MESSPGATHGQASAINFFSALLETYEHATRRRESTDKFYRIADCSLKLEFASNALVPTLCAGLAHLEVDPLDHPQLTIKLWDTASTGVQPPPAPWDWSALSFRAEVPGYSTERIRTVFDVGSGALSMLDHTRTAAVYWVRDAGKLPAFEAAHPLRTLLHWWLARHGRQLVHTAALSHGSSGVLLAGPGGSGKSTTALACLRSSLGYLGDDYCAISFDDAPRVHSLFSTAKASLQTLELLPHLQAHISNPSELPRHKAVLQLASPFAGRMRDSAPIHAVLLPRIAAEGPPPTTRLERASAIAAVRSIAPSTMVQLAGAGRSAWQAITTLVAQVPCYHLHLGQDITSLPRIIAEILHEHDDIAHRP